MAADVVAVVVVAAAAVDDNDDDAANFWAFNLCHIESLFSSIIFLFYKNNWPIQNTIHH